MQKTGYVGSTETMCCVLTIRQGIRRKSSVFGCFVAFATAANAWRTARLEQEKLASVLRRASVAKPLRVSALSKPLRISLD